MDYASRVRLPSLAPTELGHFRARTGRPVIPFSCSAKWVAENWPEQRQNGAYLSRCGTPGGGV